MTSRERIKCTLAHEEPDRVPITDAPWLSTIERWQKEGLSTNLSVADFFGYELTRIQVDVTPQYPHKTIEETKDYIMERNNFGEIVRNYRNRSSTPQVIDSPVKDRKDWERMKERLTVDDRRLVTYERALVPSSIVSWDETLERFKRDHEKGRFICFHALTGYDMIQRYLGSEKLLMAMVTEPSWVKEMFMTHAKLVIELHEFMVKKGLEFDGAFPANDMGYKNGLLFSPQCYRELILPADKLICDYFHSKSMPVILHSDGDLKELIPHLIEAGFDCLQPLEVKAGMDVRDLKREYGDRLSFMGGIDVRLMRGEGPNLIEEEIESKFSVAKKGGGYIYHSDHSVPNDVSLKQYARVIELVRKYGRY